MIQKLSTLIFFSLLVSGIANAATVSKVSSKKKKVFIKDATPEEGFAVDSTVCFFASEDDPKSVVCGVVSKAAKKNVTITMASAKEAKKVKKGMLVKVGEGEAAAGGSKAAAGKNPFRIWVGYSPTLFSPAKYNKIFYETQTDSATSTLPIDNSTLWTSEATANRQLLGFALGVGIPLGAKTLATGLRYRTYDDAPIDSNYDLRNTKVYAQTARTASSLGLWADFQFLRLLMGKSAELDVSGGLDFDMSTVNVTATRLDDDKALAEVELVSAKSSANIISLRFGAGFDYRFVSAFGINAGMQIYIPVAGSSKLSATFNDPNTAKLPAGTDPTVDLQQKLGHGKNSFGLDLTLGTVLAF
jgi:hypothetical protein